MSPHPLVSVVMSFYNEPTDWLRQSVESILQQTFSDFEFIIISDNPSNTKGNILLREYSKRDSRIVLLFNEKNIGLTKSLNKGLDIAQGDYIARMDADDISLPTRFEKQLTVFNNSPEIDVVGSNVEYFGNIEGYRVFPEKHSEMLFFIENCIAHSSVMMRRNVAKLEYNEECKAAQDYELWCRAMGRGYKFYNIQEPLLRYRWSANQISTAKSRMQNQIAKYSRRKFFDLYCDAHGYGCKMHNSPITFDLVDRILEELSINPKDQSLLVYFLFLSISNQSIKKLQLLFFNNRYRRILTIKQKLSVIEHSFKGDEIAKY